MPDASLSSGHRKRLRGRLSKGGQLADYELLELLLTYAIPRRDVKPIAKKLLLKFTDIVGVLHGSLSELCGVPGIGENAASLILLQKELCSRYLECKVRKCDVISNLTEAVDFARMKIGGNRRESALILYLGARNQLLDYECIDHGTVNRVNLFPENIVKGCLSRDAVGILLFHNHPSGICEPSPEDKDLAIRLSAALATVNKVLLDNLIVSQFKSFSFRKNNLLAPLMQKPHSDAPIE